MFRTLIYPSSGACDYSVELPRWSYRSWFDVCWSFGVVRLEWYPCCRLHHHQELASMLLNYHIGRIVLGSMCVGVSMWLDWSGIRVAGCTIIRSLRLCCSITTLVVLFLVRCALDFRCGWVGVVSVLQPEARIPLQPNHNKTPTHFEPRTIRPMW